MTTRGGSSPKISWWSAVVVPAKLFDPSVTGTAWATPPALFREVIKTDRYGTGALGGLACLRTACQCGQRDFRWRM